MLVYEKKVDDVRHLFGTLEAVPSDDDVQLTYEGAEVSLNKKYFDDKHGGIIDEDGNSIKVKIGDTYIIPAGYESEEDEDEDEQPQDEDETKNTITYNANGGTGTIDSVEVTPGESVTLDDGSGLTAPEGKEFAGWAKSKSAKTASVTSPFTPDKDVTLYAVWTDVE